MNITKETSIWHEGLPEWTTADQIYELKELFDSSTPPPFNPKTTPPPVQDPAPRKKNRLGVILQSIGAIGAVIIIIVIINVQMKKGAGSTSPDSQSYKEKVMSVEEIERSQPAKFLTASGNYNENFWGDKFKVHGVITNKATVAAYKDAVVRVTYYSKTKTVLATKEYTIYENFPPHSEVKFELKIDNYQNVSTIGWDVIQAKAK